MGGLKAAGRRFARWAARPILAVSPAQIALRNQYDEVGAVADKFDPYREALVMETNTIWPPEYDGWSPAERAAVEIKLHADPAACPQLEYIRTHTGFCRQITVTPADVERVSA